MAALRGLSWPGETSPGVQLYDPTTGTFAATGSMIQAITDNTATRTVHTATLLLPSGKVLVAGGLDKNYVFANAELYDPAVGTFTVTGSMTVARWNHSATFLGNGKVLIAGGSDTSAELYDPTAGTFAATGSMTVTRYSHTATLLLSGKVLIAGGRPGAFTASLGGPTLASAELYQ